MIHLKRFRPFTVYTGYGHTAHDTVTAIKVDKPPVLSAGAGDPAWAKAEALTVQLAGGANFKDGKNVRQCSGAPCHALWRAEAQAREVSELSLAGGWIGRERPHRARGRLLSALIEIKVVAATFVHLLNLDRPNQLRRIRPSTMGSGMRPHVTTHVEAVVLPFPAAQKSREASLASCAALPLEAADGVPAYLSAYYWWAYVHPAAVRIFERQWLANLILWGNYARLRDAALDELAFGLSGRTLQVACAYGDLTTRLSAQAAAAGGHIDVVDVLPIQLRNLRKKLPTDAPVRLLAMDSTDLKLRDASYDQALVFFLLHEQPRHCRERTLSEAIRVVKPGGKLIIVEYALPRWWQPLRYVWRPLLATLEPFALDLWQREITTWLPAPWSNGPARKESFFGGLYQKVVVSR